MYELYLTFAIVAAFIYWFVDNHNTYCSEKLHSCLKSKTLLAIIKWISVCILVILSIDLSHTLNVLKSGVLLLYSIGDVIIVWKESYSILFFMSGHILLILHALFKDLWEHIVVNHIGLWLWLSSSIFICSVSSFLLRLHRTDIENKEFLLYILYIFTLALVLILPTLASKYHGTIFFVISDVLIGFKITSFKKLTFPLYFISLLLILSLI